MNHKIFLFLFFYAFLNTCCSNIKITPNMVQMKNFYYIEKEFVPYISDFKKLSGDKNFEIKNHIVFGSLSWSDKDDKDNTVGLCEYHKRKVTIDKGYWQTLDSFEKEELIFHELGHCTLFRGHTDTKSSDGTITYYVENFLFMIGIFEKKGYLEDGCPASYMHPYTFGSYCIQKHRDYYIRELFDLKKENKGSESYGAFFKLINANIGKINKSCPETKIINTSDEPWNDRDQKEFNYIVKSDRCLKVTGMKCLKKLTKKEPQNYQAICGNP